MLLSNANISKPSQSYTIMNPRIETPPAESSAFSLTLKQRLFVFGLLFLALMISFLVIFLLDPPAAHFSCLPASVTRSSFSGALPA